MLDKIKVTAGLVFHREKSKLRAALQSLCAQTALDRIGEVLSVQNGNCQETLRHAQAFEGRLPLTVFSGSEGGQANHIGAARALIVEKAAFPLIAWTDADCLLPPDWLERLLDNWAAAAVLEGMAPPSAAVSKEKNRAAAAKRESLLQELSLETGGALPGGLAKKALQAGAMGLPGRSGGAGSFEADGFPGAGVGLGGFSGGSKGAGAAGKDAGAGESLAAGGAEPALASLDDSLWTLAGCGGPNRLPEKAFWQKLVNLSLSHPLGHGWSPQAYIPPRPVSVSHLPAANALFSVEKIREAGNFSADEKYRRTGEDLDLGLRLSLSGPLYLFPDPVVVNDHSASFVQSLFRLFRFGLVRKRRKDRLLIPALLFAPVLLFSLSLTAHRLAVVGGAGALSGNALFLGPGPLAAYLLLLALSALQVFFKTQRLLSLVLVFVWPLQHFCYSAGAFLGLFKGGGGGKAAGPPPLPPIV